MGDVGWPEALQYHCAIVGFQTLVLHAVLLDPVLVVLELVQELEVVVLELELEVVVLEQEIGKLADFPAACSLVVTSLHVHFVLEHDTCCQLECPLTLLPAQFAFARRIV